MKKIGILYICTGNYNVFWKDFYESFEKNFINNYELHYFVFTDANEIYDETNERVHKKKLESLPWPLVTLFRFRTFLSIEDELKDMDYLMFSNSNMICEQKIEADEFLPRDDRGEQLFVTIHPGYQHTKIKHVPYDRNVKSSAYVPYNMGKYYVIGAMNGGTSKAFLKMSHVLNAAIEEDLKKNVIARWHDESHLNRYIIDRDDVRVLAPDYCYPDGMNVTYSKKIYAVNKMAKFDVQSFKGVYNISEKEKLRKRINIINGLLKDDVLSFKDHIFNSKIKPYK